MRSATGQKARVRAKCVRAKVAKCGVRACGQKSVTPNTLAKIKFELKLWRWNMLVRSVGIHATNSKENVTGVVPMDGAAEKIG